LSALTKIFIVLQLVCSLVVAVVLVVALKAQDNYKKDAESQHAALVQTQAAVQQKSGAYALLQTERDRLADELRNSTGNLTQKNNDLIKQKGDVEIERDSLKAQITVEGNKISQLTAANESLAKENARVNEENRRMAPEIARLIQQNAELSRANNDAVIQNQFHEKTIRKLQEALAAAQATKSGAAATSDSGTVAMLSTQAPAKINGTVTQSVVSAGRTLVEVGLGARDGVKEGARYVISRNGTFVAEAVVEKVTPDASVAVTTDNVKKGETIQAGDLVTAGAPQ